MATGAPAALRLAYEPHERQARVHASAARFRVVIAGRQSGKTRTGIAEIAQWAMEAPGRQLWWVTASLKTKDKAWRDLLEHMPRSLIRTTHATELYIELHNGSRITIRSAAAPESLVSETLDGIVCDEFAQWPSEIWHQLLRPMLTVRTAPVLFIGSPRGRNWAYDLYQSALASDDPEWAAFHWSSRESPYFSQEEWDKAERETPARVFQQEYLAEFLADGNGDVFRNVDAAIGPLGKPDNFTVLGVDLARVKDSTCIWALNSAGETVEVQRFNDLSWAIQAPRIMEAYQRLRACKVLLDVTGMHVGSDAVQDDLRSRGLIVEPVTITGGLKRSLIEALMLRFDNGSIRIPNDPVVLDEFKSFTYETLPSGYDRYSAPGGRHDDTVLACALAVYGIRQFAGRRIAPPPKSELELWIERDLQRAVASQNPQGSGWTY